MGPILISHTPFSRLGHFAAELKAEHVRAEQPDRCAFGAKIRKTTCRSGVTSGDVNGGRLRRRAERLSTGRQKAEPSVWYCMQHRVYNGSSNERKSLPLRFPRYDAPFALARARTAPTC